MAWAYMAMADHNRQQNIARPVKKRPTISTPLDFRHVSGSSFGLLGLEDSAQIRADSAVGIEMSQYTRLEEGHSLVARDYTPSEQQSPLDIESQTLRTTAEQNVSKRPTRKLTKRRATFDLLEKQSRSTVKEHNLNAAEDYDRPALTRRVTISPTIGHTRSPNVMQHVGAVDDQTSKHRPSQRINDMAHRSSHTRHTASDRIVEAEQNVVTKMACSTVMSSDEFVQNILGHIRSRDVLACMRVSKCFRQAIEQSTDLRRKVFLAPAQCQLKYKAILNPLLSSLGEISQSNSVHAHIDTREYTPPTNPTVLERYGRYYTAEAFFDRASNPCIHQEPETGATYLYWQLRELSKAEVVARCKSLLAPAPQASYWNMYLCQPPPMAIRVSIWKRVGQRESLRLAGPLDSHPVKTGSAVTERFQVQAWTVREIFDRIEEARLVETRSRYTTAYQIAKAVHQKPDLRNVLRHLMGADKKTKALTKAVVDRKVMAPSAATWMRGMGGMI